MHLQKLSLVNFKNYEQAELDFSPKINSLVGDNGVGKTNLLDAIYYLSFCKSYFNPSDNQNIKHKGDFFVIQGEFERVDSPVKIHCGFKRNHKKSFKKNGKEYQRLSEHIGFLPVVIVSPADAVLISGGSEERRKFIDSVISQSDKIYLQNLIKYNRAVSQRNVLLKDFFKKGTFDVSMIELWDMQLIQYGEFIYKKRLEFIESFTPNNQKSTARLRQVRNFLLCMSN